MPASHPLSLFLQELEHHRTLDADEKQAVLALPLHIRALDAGSYIVREGSHIPQCCLLLEGYAYRQKVTGDGSRQIMAVCVPGDPIDLQNIFLDVSDHAVQMLTRGKVADLPRTEVQNLILGRPTVGAAIIQMSLVEASILREWVVNVGRRDARERIAHLLCEFAVRLESRGLASPGSFELPMTQEQLADATGLTPVHVNRVLKSLESEGLIRRQRRFIQFDDWRALQEAGDFSRQYLHLPAEDVLHPDEAGFQL